MNTKNMKHILTISCFLFIIILFIPCCTASVSVSPTNLSIIMKEDIIDGNTTQKITVTNKNSYNISVRAWMIHPDIIEWIRPNRTLIDNLSWITIEPGNKIISGHSTDSFYVYINIPDEAKNQIYDKKWEIWAALQVKSVDNDQSNLFGEGYLIRVYVDAPESPVTPKDSEFILSPFQIILLFVFLILVILVYYYIRRKKVKE